MNTNQVTRFIGNQKITTFAEPAPFDKKRATEIVGAVVCGNYDAVMTDGEISYVRRVWFFMDGNTSFRDALIRVLTENLPYGFYLDCNLCASADSGHNVHCKNNA